MILITGATGTVGREVVTRLSAQGLEVRAVTATCGTWTRIGSRTLNTYRVTSKTSSRCAERALASTGRSC
jgi:NAD(P)-dependent dehydrogenase (short-subunit alcohol dehydrogenase family)